MKFKLDENLPGLVAQVLADLGHDAHTAAQEGLSGAQTTTFCKLPLRSNACS